MLKKPPSFVLGSSKSSTYPRGAPPVSTRLRPCWRTFWASCVVVSYCLKHSEHWIYCGLASLFLSLLVSNVRG